MPRSASSAENGKVTDASEYDWAKSSQSPFTGTTISADEQRRQSLREESRRLSKLIDEISSSLTEREARIAELEVMFSNPELYDDPDRIAVSGREYRALKEEVESLWEKWEGLAAEAERVEGELAGDRFS